MTVQPNMTDYDKEYREFKWQVPEYYNFAGDVFDKWAQDRDKLAMLWVDDHGTEIKKHFMNSAWPPEKWPIVLTQSARETW
jgi:hypothetical protein